MTELSWPIEKIEPHPAGTLNWWTVTFKGAPSRRGFSSDELAAAGIPAEPYPTPPVTITVTVGDRSEEVELTKRNVQLAVNWPPEAKTIEGLVGAALRRLGVQP